MMGEAPKPPILGAMNWVEWLGLFVVAGVVMRLPCGKQATAGRETHTTSDIWPIKKAVSFLTASNHSSDKLVSGSLAMHCTKNDLFHR
jgi:hypothetical protein